MVILLISGLPYLELVVYALSWKLSLLHSHQTMSQSSLSCTLHFSHDFIELGPVH